LAASRDGLYLLAFNALHYAAMPDHPPMSPTVPVREDLDSLTLAFIQEAAGQLRAMDTQMFTIFMRRLI
jgi:hypothetical protein